MADNTNGGAGNRPTIHRLTITGHTPQTKGSMKCIGARGRIAHQLIEDDKTGDRKKWRALVTDAARQLAGNYEPNTALVVGLLALVERPASAAKRVHPTTRSSGDIDKHLRMLADALDDAGVYDDDSRIVTVIARKAYSARAGAVIYIAPEDDPAAVTILHAIIAATPEH